MLDPMILKWSLHLNLQTCGKEVILRTDTGMSMMRLRRESGMDGKRNGERT